MVSSLDKQELNEVISHLEIIDSDDDNIIKRTFNSGILDRFDRMLSEEEASRLLTNKQKNIEDEVLYLDCLHRIFEVTKRKEVFIRSSKLFNEDIDNYYFKEELDPFRCSICYLG